MTTFPVVLGTCDEQWRWDKYAIAAPVSKKQIILGRYLSCLIALAVSIAIAFLLNLVTYLLLREYDFTLHLVVLAVGFLAGFLYLLIIIPSGYAWGTTGGSTVMFILLIAVLGSVSQIRKVDLRSFSLPELPIGVITAIAGAGVIIFAVLSFAVSVNIYTKKHS